MQYHRGEERKQRTNKRATKSGAILGGHRKKSNENNCRIIQQQILNTNDEGECKWATTATATASKNETI